MSKATALIPNLRWGKDGFYCSNAFRVIKKQIQEKVGVEFRLKVFRPTFAQISIDMNPNLMPDVSTVLGHANLKTTQRYYAQIPADSARQRLDDAWKNR
jgi:integrase